MCFFGHYLDFDIKFANINAKLPEIVNILRNFSVGSTGNRGDTNISNVQNDEPPNSVPVNLDPKVE